MRIQNTERQMTHIFILNSLLLRKNEMMMISKRCKKTNEPSQQILPTMQIIAQGILEYDIHLLQKFELKGMASCKSFVDISCLFVVYI